MQTPFINAQASKYEHSKKTNKNTVHLQENCLLCKTKKYQFEVNRKLVFF